MGKPSIFSSDYQRVMRRRKRIIRALFVIAAILLFVITYNKPAIQRLKTLADILKTLPKKSVSDTQYGKNADKSIQDNSDGKADSNDNSSSSKSEESAEDNTGEYLFTFSNNETVSLVYSKDDTGSKFTGIKPDNLGISFDISDDGKSVTFDNPKTSEIWLYNIDGTNKRLDPDLYKMSGENGNVFNKVDVLKEYSGYI